ncbi:MAG: class I SAM-dependent methyltransferase [Pseudomonadota bacterium]
MPTQESFWNKAADKYAAQPVRNEAAYKATIERVRSRLTQDMAGLEVGCGTGTTALLLADAIGSLLATDVSTRMIEIAEQKRLDQNAENVTFRAGLIDDPQLQAASFDVVLAFNLVHLVPDRQAFLASVKALLKPGGLFISKTPCVKEMNLFIPIVIKGLQLIGKAPNVESFGPDELKSDIQSAGFEILEEDVLPKPSWYIVARA